MECRICNTETDIQFKIKKELVNICEKCSTIIFIEQAKSYAYSRSIFNPPKSQRKLPPRHPEIAVEILNFLNEKLGKRKRYTLDSKKAKTTVNLDTVPEVFLKLISARVEEGHSLMKMKAVVHHKHREWKDDPFMKKFLRPATLFNNEKFNTYVQEVPEDFNPDNSREQRDIIRKLSNYGMRGVCNEETDALAKQLMQTGYEKKEFLNIYLIEKI
ncbi:replication initiation protein [Maribacter phage Panino]